MQQYCFFILILFSLNAIAQNDSIIKEKSFDNIKIGGTKKYIQKEAGKTTYQVSQSITNTGGTLEDVLRKLPNMRIDQNGNITIAGKQSVSIWVDGKPSPMSAADMNSFIKSMQASSIESIEVITNPGAKYDAQGTGGIIHLKLKKEKKQGTNGSISAGYGLINRCNTNFSINKKEGDWNVFANYGYQRTYYDHIYEERRLIQLPDSTYHYNMYNVGTSPTQSHNFKSGIDYFFSNGSISYTFNAIVANGAYISTATGRWFNVDTTNKINSIPIERNKRVSYSHDISVKKTLDTSGKEISASLIYSYVPSISRSTFMSEEFDRDDNKLIAKTIDQNMSNKNAIQNLICQLDYATHLQGLSKVEMGIKSELTWNKNAFELNNLINGEYRRNVIFSNQFDYFENISAGYLSIEKKITSSLITSIGFRVENTNIKSNNNAVSRNYTNVFPNLRLTKSFTEMRSFGVAVTSRISRPQFSQLNNAVFYNDPYTTWQGNPLLRPSTEYIFTMNYSDSYKKWMTSIDLNGASISNKISEGTKLDSVGIARSGYYNGAQGYYGSIVWYNRFDINKYMDYQISNTYTFQYYEKLVGINNNSIIGHNYSLWNSLNLKFNRYGSLEIVGWLESGGVFSQGNAFPMGSVDMGYKLNFYKNWSFTMNMVNLFNTMNFRWSVANGYLSESGKWHMMTRTLFLTISYKFGGISKFNRQEHQQNDRLTGGGR